MGKQPIAETFGYPISNYSRAAEKSRKEKLCPFNNKVSQCTKSNAKDPLGVCSVIHEGKAVITCPIRFREEWKIASDAASFFFPPTATWARVTEVRIADEAGTEAGNIDLVLASLDADGSIVDFGTVEVQAVYISGNIGKAFRYYMQNRKPGFDMDWSDQENYPRPDYLSSSRKRLAPQLTYKGGIIHAWGKKMAVAVQRSFFETLPAMPRVSLDEAEMVWLVYDLDYHRSSDAYSLSLKEKVYTRFHPSLEAITEAEAGSIDNFIIALKKKLDETKKNTDRSSPRNMTLE